MVERELRNHVPPDLGEHPDCRLDDGSVCPINQAISLATAPLGMNAHNDVELSCDTPKFVHPDAFESPKLDIRYQLLADSCSRRDVRLTKVARLPHRSEEAADSAVIHGWQR